MNQETSPFLTEFLPVPYNIHRAGAYFGILSRYRHTGSERSINAKYYGFGFRWDHCQIEIHSGMIASAKITQSTAKHKQIATRLDTRTHKRETCDTLVPEQKKYEKYIFQHFIRQT